MNMIRIIRWVLGFLLAAAYVFFTICATIVFGKNFIPTCGSPNFVDMIFDHCEGKS